MDRGSKQRKARDRWGRAVYGGDRGTLAEELIGPDDLLLDERLWVSVSADGTGVLVGFDFDTVRDKAEWLGHARRQDLPQYRHYYGTYRVRLSARAVDLARAQADRYAERRAERDRSAG